MVTNGRKMVFLAEHSLIGKVLVIMLLKITHKNIKEVSLMINTEITSNDLKVI